MEDADFARLARFIQSRLGIRMPDVKRVMLESRLHRRMKSLGFATFAEYVDFVFSPEGEPDELQNMIDAVTTNKTDFFREADHFRILVDTALPSLRSAGARRTRVWSAGCSTGEEPYSIAMTLVDAGVSSFSIVGTDISWQVLKKAREGVYPLDKIATVPDDLKRRHFLKSKDPGLSLARVKPEIRRMVEFAQVNLMDDDYPFAESFDVVFCRNVIIYFDRPTQERILSRVCSFLVPGGYLFLGHSEALTGLDLPLTNVANTVHRRLPDGSRA